jgi:16S rRNA (cytidine1402-2'-O)-methyltransferase
MDTGVLSIVATPIGNLEDITLRALRVLKEADYILCEDTRVTGKLLKHYDIAKPLKRYDAHTSEQTHLGIIDDIKSGKKIALVSDAGTPGISDPGVLLVQRARAAGARIEAIPGPSAIAAAFSIAGIAGNQFAFLGYAPQKKGRETFFKSLSSYEIPVIFFESTHRIMKTLEALKNLSIDGKVSIGRELTKMHEEMVSGTPEEVFNYFDSNKVHQKGEFVVMIH